MVCCKKLTYLTLPKEIQTLDQTWHCLCVYYRKGSLMANRAQNKALATIFLFQGAYFVVTGIWPVLNMASFITATGPKQDTWLVEMVGLLSASIGLTYLVASLRKQRLPLVLGYATSVSFLVMDITYVASQVINRIYLLDAAIQCLFLTALTFFLIKDRSASGKLQR